jgi:hypothetical protein
MTFEDRFFVPTVSARLAIDRAGGELANVGAAVAVFQVAFSANDLVIRSTPMIVVTRLKL